MLSKQQREALTALRDVMEKYNIDIDINTEGYYGYSVYLEINMVADFKQIDLGQACNIDSTDINRILETEPNDSKRVAGRDFTGTGGDV